MSSNESTTATEFVAQEFETAVTTTEEDRFIEAIDGAVSNLRDQIDDDTLESILRADPGSYQLKSSMTKDGLQPESFTQEAVINPLLDALDYEYQTEAGGLSGGQTQVADYTVSLRDHLEIDSTRLLIEAEPINKDLDSRKHGIGQVRDWLSQREFESDFGFATDGLRWVFIRYDPDSYAHNIIEEIDLQPVFLALFMNQVGKRENPTDVVFDADRDRVTRVIRTFEYENFVSIAGDARRVIKAKREQVTDEFYDDYIRYVFGIVGEDEETTRSLVGDGVVVPAGAGEDDARLFSVELMNRLVFIKFLEDKALVNPDLLQTLVDTYEDGMYVGSFYESLLQPLFYDVMNEQRGNRPANVQNIDLFQGIPYLNGGLFRPTINGDDFEEGDFDVRNSVLFSIIDLLERYSFSAGGAPTDLDPSILGNVFEKTINYITSDNADTNKELGAYYTPSEITRFCAEETVRPALLDRFATVLIEKRDWPEAEATAYDTVYELIEDLPGNFALISALLAEINDFRVVDPSCGSGHFLTSVLEEIVTIRKALYAQNESYPDEYKLRKATVLNNIYGVDLMGPAVEIAKLRLWLSVISALETENVDDLADDDALALPNIAFNLREGNSLIGYTGFPEQTNTGEYTLENWRANTVRERYDDIIEAIHGYQDAVSSDQAQQYRENAIQLLEKSRDEFSERIADEFNEAGATNISASDVEVFEPFNWVLEFAEVYADGGFDAVVGNPPWEQLQPSRDDFFPRYDPIFRMRMPDDKDQKQAEILEDEEIAREWERYQEQMGARADYYKSSQAYIMQSPSIDGRSVPSKRELSGLFLERIFSLTDENGHVAQVLPGRIFNGTSGKDLRDHLVNDTSLKYIIGFENKGIFNGIDDRYNFGVCVFKNSGTTESVRGIFQQHDLEILRNPEEETIEIPRNLLDSFSPKVRLIPLIQSRAEVDVLLSIISHPAIEDEIDERWQIRPYMELNRTTDRDRYVESEAEGDYPVYGGSNVNQFTHRPFPSAERIEPPKLWSVEESRFPDKSAKRRIREKNIRLLKRTLYDALGGTGSQKSFVNEYLEEQRGEPLSLEDVQLDCTEYRIVYRDIARATDERTLIASVIPPNVVCHDKLHTVRPFRIEVEENRLDSFPLDGIYVNEFSAEELFVAVGMVNSIPFDYLMRRKTDTTVIMYKLKESQLPRLTEGDEWFDYISTRAARLNCYGDDFEEMRDRLGGIEPATEMDERREVQAELDAAVFHAYGLDRDQTAFVLDDFHRVQNPRLMDEDYFEMVLEKYDELA